MNGPTTPARPVGGGSGARRGFGCGPIGRALVAGTLLAAAAAWGQPVRWRVAVPVSDPIPVAAQSPATAAIGARMAELGVVIGRDLAFELRSTEGRRERADAVAAELVALRPDLVMVPTCGHLLDAMRRATRTIPIVVAGCTDDMVAAGIVRSLARPGGNVTGLQKLTPELSAKRLELLRELMPGARRVAVLWNPDYSSFDADWRSLRGAAAALGITLLPVAARSEGELDAAFAEASAWRAEGMLTLSDPMTFEHPKRVADLASAHRLPIITPYREAADAGGTIAYGPNVLALVRRASEMTVQILKGARPAEMPVEQPARFDFVVNARAAKALGLAVPVSLRLRADEVIE